MHAWHCNDSKKGKYFWRPRLPEEGSRISSLQLSREDAPTALGSGNVMDEIRIETKRVAMSMTSDENWLGDGLKQSRPWLRFWFASSSMRTRAQGVIFQDMVHVKLP